MLLLLLLLLLVLVLVLVLVLLLLLLLQQLLLLSTDNLTQSVGKIFVYLTAFIGACNLVREGGQEAFHSDI